MEGAEGSEADDAGGREPVSAASRLNDDLILNILSRLPARSLHRFRCVSRHWRDLIRNPGHRGMMAQTLAGFLYIGWTCDESHKASDKSLQFTSAPAGPGGNGGGGEAPAIDPSALSSLSPGYQARLYRIECCNGHLLIRSWDPSVRGKINYAVCNPATDELAAVPDPPTQGATCTSARLALDPPPAAGAGAPPSRRSYRIFEFQSDLVTMSVRSPAVWIYSSETGAWAYRECGWANGDGVTLRDESSGVYHRGRLHLCPV
ncbi:hypothetical protein C2845_PM04G17740 [Panicum miliaceum]|uniref:F-box domain-containing protein n=1 Tax=Panicum miliaceum TaxID=4540 RepID=A0A3L6QKX7_PANMI|nr:hypothetical protein C2845_PM04G17740 [Panicum miliaceum]